MKKVYVRWLAAFAGHQYSLKDSITFEVSRKDEAACEPLSKWRDHGLCSGVATIGQVGLLISPKKIFREFRGDCWSYYGGDKNKSYAAKADQNPGRLYAKRPGYLSSNHAEAWAHMDNAVIGIVVRGTACNLKQEKRNVILKMAARFNLKVYRLQDGELSEEKGGIFGEK